MAFEHTQTDRQERRGIEEEAPDNMKSTGAYAD